MVAILERNVLLLLSKLKMAFYCVIYSHLTTVLCFPLLLSPVCCVATNFPMIELPNQTWSSVVPIIVATYTALCMYIHCFVLFFQLGDHLSLFSKFNFLILFVQSSILFSFHSTDIHDSSAIFSVTKCFVLSPAISGRIMPRFR